MARTEDINRGPGMWIMNLETIKYEQSRGLDMLLKFGGITGKLRKINTVIYGNGGILRKTK